MDLASIQSAGAYATAVIMLVASILLLAMVILKDGQVPTSVWAAFVLGLITMESSDRRATKAAAGRRQV